jgi:hypothetical protein
MPLFNLNDAAIPSPQVTRTYGETRGQLRAFPNPGIIATSQGCSVELCKRYNEPRRGPSIFHQWPIQPYAYNGLIDDYKDPSRGLHLLR